MRGYLRRLGTHAARSGLAALAALITVAGPQDAPATPTPMGTIIRNVAQTSYFNSGLGVRETVFSNAVEAHVAPVPGMDVTGYTDQVLSRGAIDQYYYEIRNTGNTGLEVAPAMRFEGAYDLMLDRQLILDLNENGAVDPDEPLVSAGDAFQLAPSESLSLIYGFRVANSAQSGDWFSAFLTVEADAQGVPTPIVFSGEGQGQTTIVPGGLELEKLQGVAPGSGGARLIYTFRLRNNSDSAIAGYDEIDGVPLRVDGTAMTGILLDDTIPLNTTFDTVVEPGGMTPLYHRRGDGERDYTSTPPADPAEIDAVAFLLEGDFPVGRSADPAFSVRVADDGGEVTVENFARTHMGTGASYRPIQSNTVFHSGPTGAPASLEFVDPLSREPTTIGLVGEDTRVILRAFACNVTSGVDIIDVTLTSATTGDVETLAARETGPNTGVFEIAPLPLVSMPAPAGQDGVLASGNGDIVEATARCANETLRDEITVNPGNFLFNSLTNAPIAGVEVMLRDAVSRALVDSVITDARGFFVFDDVPAGSYRYEVDEAEAWVFPATQTDFFGYDRRVNEAGYGTAFTHEGGYLAVSDIPVDPYYGTPIALEKTAERDRVYQGEFLRYTVRLRNNMNQALLYAEVIDSPPRGVEFVPGSATLEGAPLEDPRRDPGDDLAFELGTLDPLGAYELSYLMRFTSAAREGNNRNRAYLFGYQAGTGALIESPMSQSTVRLDNSGGVFARQGTVIGSVFMDCNGNGLRDDAREPGIPGVRIVTQSGLFVVTDRDGKYSLPALRPITHAFQIQTETLPAGTRVAITRTNDLRRGGSRIVPLRRGELRAENFAVRSCSPEALTEVKARRTHFEEESDGRRALTTGDLPIQAQRGLERSARSEAGVATTSQLTSSALETHDQAREAAKQAGKRGRSAAARRAKPLETMVRSLDAQAAFLGLADGAVLSNRTINIRVKGKADLRLGLKVNDRPVGSEKVGQRSTWAARNVQALEFVAVRLRPGTNTLTLVGRDDFGIERLSHQITVTAPGDPARIEIVAPATAGANPASVLPVVVRLLDARGNPVTASAAVTLQARHAKWDVRDIRPNTPGIQAFIDNGEATFSLVPPQTSGPETVRVSSSFGSAEARISFTPELSERVMVGVIEGAVSLRDGGSDTLLPRNQFSHFEETTTGLRGELYLKGVIRGDTLLTLRYTSDRDTEDSLFRDVRSDEYYPVYGDSSEQGFDAQSSSNIYVKVEKGRSYVLYGDIAIEPESSAFQLGGQRRVTTGAKAHWENDRVSVTVFGAYTAQEQQVVEIPGRGVSGPYDLSLKGYIEGSERVEILVRDEQGGDILTATPQRRGTDYLLDFFRNTITFDTPVRQFDPEGNPVSIRVTYEVEAEDAERYWLYGGEVNYAIGERTMIGARVVHADAPSGNKARQRLQSAYLRHEGRRGGTWEAEVANSEDSEGRTDTAARLAFNIENERERFDFEAIYTGRYFIDGGGLARAGTTQVRLSYAVEVSDQSELSLSAEYVQDRVNDTETLSFDALYSRRFNAYFRGEVGLEHNSNISGGRTIGQTFMILGADWRPSNRPNTAIKARLRFPIAGEDTDPAELTLGMYREPEKGWRAFNEVEIRFEDRVFISRARLGFDYQLNDWLSGSTEFTRAPGEAEATLHQSLAVTWAASDFTTLTFALEHSRKAQSGEDRLTSLALGAKWESATGDFVGDADFDTTIEDSGNTYYASLGLASQVTPDLALLGRTRVAVDQRAGEESRRIRTRVGAAYRPLENPRLEVLAWYEHRIEKKYGRNITHMWSIDANYEISDDLRVNGKYAGQHQRISVTESLLATATTQMIQAGVNYEFGDDRFQVGLNAAHLWDSDGNSSSGLGAEFGISPAKGTMIAVGYNATQGQVAGQDSLFQSGWYLRFILLLDNSLWDRIEGFLGA